MSNAVARCILRRFFSLLLFFSFGANADVITADQFGLHIHGLARGNSWPSVPFGTLRLWDTGTNWERLEPRRGEWKFEELDLIVAQAQLRGVKVLLTLGQTPSWAALDPESDSPYAPGASSPPRDISDWKNYVRTVGERYKGRIQYWEIWNEIDVKHFYNGSFKRLAELERVAVEVLKDIDEANIILTPSVQSGAFKVLERYLDSGGGRFADVVSYHFYVPKDDPEEIPSYVMKVRSILEKYRLGSKPIWNTEAGWLIENRNGGFGPNRRPAAMTWRGLKWHEAEGIVLRAYLINFSTGVQRFFWYAWDNQAMGLAEDKGRNPKPAAAGYATAYRWLVGKQLVGCAKVESVHYCHTRFEGKNSYIVWARKEMSFSVPVDWSVNRFEDMNERYFEIKQNVVVGPMPIRLLQ